MPDGRLPGRLILIIWSMPLTGALPQLPESHRQALGGQSETADENAEQRSCVIGQPVRGEGQVALDLMSRQVVQSVDRIWWKVFRAYFGYVFAEP